MLQIPAKDFKNIRIYFQLPVFLSHTIWKSLPFFGGEERRIIANTIKLLFVSSVS